MLKDKEIFELFDLRQWLKVHTLAAEYKYQTNTNQYVTGYIAACECIYSHINHLLGYRDDGVNGDIDLLEK